MGWWLGGGLGLLQGLALLPSDQWRVHIWILPQTFLLYAFPTSILALVWGSIIWRACRILRRGPSRGGVMASFVVILLCVPIFVHVHVNRLPGISLLAPVSVAWSIVLFLGGVLLFFVIRLLFRILTGLWKLDEGLSLRRAFLHGVLPLTLLVLLAALAPIVSWPGNADRSSALKEGCRLPHVVVIVMDTTRMDRLSCYGYPRPTTPFLESLSARGVKFTSVISPSPWTLPSHASILTSRYPKTHGAHMGHWRLGDENRTLPEILQEAGFFTACFVSNPFLSRVFNLDQGFDVYDDELESWFYRTQLWRIATRLGAADRWKPHYAERRAGATVSRLSEYLDSQRGEPCFLFLNFNDPHAPYLPPEPYRSRFLRNPDYRGLMKSPSTHDDIIRVSDAGLGSEDLEYLGDLYDGELAYLDGVLAELFDDLERRFEDRGMILVVTGDHGESFGEHDLLGHRGSLHYPLLSVPLIFYGPGIVPEGVVVSDRVQTTDIAPTLLELLCIDVPMEMEGAGLGDLWLPRPAPPPGGDEKDREGFAELYPDADLTRRIPDFDRRLTAFFRGAWKLIAGDDGTSLLYNVVSDPDETQDESEHEQETVADMVLRVETWVGEGQERSESTPLDAATAERLRSLGYLE
ncbi:MAG: sulfatase [Candidatus Eisenbacteria bacterium]|nr:sulfatase [Candidatus Eisenbacteria bacterium]